ncbi:SDR family oxidoreductase, partial [Escherichia sp. HC-CC]
KTCASLFAIIHCGGDVRHYGDRDHFQKVNVESTRYLLQMSKKAGARFHYISTCCPRSKSCSENTNGAESSGRCPAMLTVEI